MKLKILFFALMISVFSIVSFAQEKSFELEITLGKTTFSVNERKVPVVVKITNLSDMELDTILLDEISFYFSRCSKNRVCDKHGDIFSASARIKSATLKKNGSVEFEVELADLYWNDLNPREGDVSGATNLTLIPATSRFFYARIKLLDKYIQKENNPTPIPVYKIFGSNEIEVSIEKIP